MVARIPLIVNPDAAQIQELPAGDTLAVDGLTSITATADGTIAANAAVILTSDGKAKAISTVAESHGSQGNWFNHTGSVQVKAVNDVHWDTWANDVIINWTDSNDARKITVGVKSGSGFNFNPVGQSFGSQYTPAIASNNNGTGIILWRQSSNSGDSYGGDLLYQTYVLSDQNMTLGVVRRNLSPFQLNTNDAQDRLYIQYLEKEGNSHYYVMAYRWGTAGANGQKAMMRILKWNAQNNVELGTEVAYEGTVATSNSDRAAIRPKLVALEKGRYLLFDRGVWKVCTRIGTDFRIGPSDGTAGISIVGATATDAHHPIYDPRTKYLISRDASVTPAGLVIYSVHGERIDYHFKVNLPSGVGNGHFEMTDKGQILYSYIDGAFGNGKQIIGTFNDERDYVTWATATTWSTNADNMGGQPRIVKGDDGEVIHVFYTGSSGNEDGAVNTSQTATTTLTEDNFLGFSSDGYSNGQAARIKILGSTTTQSGLTIGEKYYVQDDGTIGTSKASLGVVAGKALSATSLLITPV